MENIQYQSDKAQIAVNSFIRSTYNWMATGLALTGIIAFWVANSQVLLNIIYGNPMIFYGMLIGEFALVWYLSSRVADMKAGTATTLFMIYSALNGATLSFIFIRYAGATIATTFFICAGTFTACSIYGMTTKKDLTSLGSFMFMGLIGIIIASVVNIFLGSSLLYFIISYVGVIVFIGLTAYDTQKLKEMAMTQPDNLDAGTIRKGAIIGALTLYLDFINLFIMMLMIFGGGDD